MNLFFELIQISIGLRECFSIVPSVTEWEQIYLAAKRQTLLGVCFSALEKLPQEQLPPKRLLLNWYAIAESIKKQNVHVNQVIPELVALLKDNSFKSIVLKG